MLVSNIYTYNFILDLHCNLIYWVTQVPKLVPGYGVGPTNFSKLISTQWKKNGSVDGIFLKIQ